MRNTTIHPTARFLYLVLGLIGISALSNAVSLSTIYAYIHSGCETFSYSDYSLKYLWALSSMGFVSFIVLLVIYIKLLRNKHLQLSGLNKAGVWCLLATLIVPMIINVAIPFIKTSQDGIVTATSYFVSALAIAGFFLLVFKTDLPIVSKIAIIAWKPAILLLNKIWGASQILSTPEAWEQLGLQNVLWLTIDIVVIAVALIAFKVEQAKRQPSSNAEETLS